MILSVNNQLSDHQAITATARSENVIDLGLPGTPHGVTTPLNRDIGWGTKTPFLVQVTEDFNNLTSLTVSIEVGSTDALGTVITSQVIPLADAVAGKQLSFGVLPEGIKGQYLGVRYTVTGTAPTTGRITAGITAGNQTNVTGA